MAGRESGAEGRRVENYWKVDWDVVGGNQQEAGGQGCDK